MENGKVLEAVEGPYGEEGTIVQEFYPLPKFGDSYTLIGSWLINDCLLYTSHLRLRELDYFNHHRMLLL